MYFYHKYNSPLGELTIASNEENIIGLWFDNQKYYMDILINKRYQEKETDVIKLAKKWLDRYFNNEKPNIKNLPLEFIGSDFRKQVWKILIDIPYGKLITYKDIAEKLARQRNIKTMSSQAVGNAVAKNPISIIVPCHRVVGINGNLTGYAGGINQKIKLLKLENVETKNLFIPKKKKSLNERRKK